jgi:hypothetical protein
MRWGEGCRVWGVGDNHSNFINSSTNWSCESTKIQTLRPNSTLAATHRSPHPSSLIPRNLASVQTTYECSSWTGAKCCHVTIWLGNQSFATVIIGEWLLDPIGTNDRLILPIVFGTPLNTEDTDPMTIYLAAEFSPDRGCTHQPT